MPRLVVLSVLVLKIIVVILSYLYATVLVVCAEKTAAKVVPYFDGKYLHEGAALNGGNAISLFVDFVADSMRSLGCDVTKGTVALITLYPFFALAHPSSSELLIIPKSAQSTHPLLSGLRSSTIIKINASWIKKCKNMKLH